VSTSGPGDTDLPFIDEHAMTVDAPPERIWTALLSVLRRAMGGAGPWARVLGCDPLEGTAAFEGRAGDALPGFRVAGSEPGRRLALRGRHRFARYALTFLVDGNRLRALSHGEFPGALGALYRAMVIGTGAHRIITRRLLSRVARAATPAPRRARAAG
jgi:hypothetical protein